MSDHLQHLSDEEILQFIDNELPANRSEYIREHMATCAKCLARQESMEGTLHTLNEFYTSEPFELSSIAVRSRTLLQEKLTEGRMSPSFRHGHITGVLLYLPIAAAIILVFIGVAFYGGQIRETKPSLLSSREETIIPNRSLTPGAVRIVTLKDICFSTDDDLDPRVPPSKERAVLQEYGISSSTSVRTYQIDYLVNPQLGGTNDIKNLWPEPYSNIRWNAQDKDELERHLHQMVCNRTVDLAVAQREIATDWVAAYKKYMGRNS